jgi:hypothetical protein
VYYYIISNKKSSGPTTGPRTSGPRTSDPAASDPAASDPAASGLAVSGPSSDSSPIDGDGVRVVRVPISQLDGSSGITITF